MAKQNQVKRKYSRPVITKSLVMNSEASIVALDSYINNTLSNLFALDVILFFIGDDSVAEAANDKVKVIFDEKIALFNKDIQKYQQIVDDLELDMAGYTETKQKEFKVYSPLASVYLRMMGKFELVTNLLDTIWINGELTSRVRKDRVVKLSAHMRNVSAQVSNIGKHAMAVANSQGKAKEARSEMKELNIDSEVAIEQETPATVAKAVKVANKTTRAEPLKDEDSELSLTEIIAKEKAKTEQLEKSA